MHAGQVFCCIYWQFYFCQESVLIIYLCIYLRTLEAQLNWSNF